MDESKNWRLELELTPFLIIPNQLHFFFPTPEIVAITGLEVSNNQGKKHSTREFSNISWR